MKLPDITFDLTTVLCIIFSIGAIILALIDKEDPAFFFGIIAMILYFNK